MRNLKIFLLLLLSAAIHHGAQAAVVDSLSLRSDAMQKDIPSLVLLPDSYSDTTLRFPVVYLLHGYGGDYSQWLRIAPQLTRLADEYNIIIVCADGGKRSWYIDSPADSSFRYETYIIRELIPEIDKLFRTRNERLQRAITGLSMGGHGALYLAIRNSDVFAAAGSMSGSFDLLESSPSFADRERILGDTLCCKEQWISHSIVSLIDKPEVEKLKLIIDCGTEDSFIRINRIIHQKLIERNISLDYSERPGGHNAAYWRESIDKHLRFFNEVF